MARRRDGPRRGLDLRPPPGQRPGADADAGSFGALKRAVAADVLAVMHQLGERRLGLAGHDRGGAVALRLVLDHPEAISRAAFLDALPIIEHLDPLTVEFATARWHWFFFAQPEIPERVINADPDAWYKGDPARMGPENYAERQTAIHDPDVVRAMLEDYRAGLTIDREHEQADRADDVTGFGIDSGHHVAEDAPDELASALGGFFRAP